MSEQAELHPPREPQDSEIPLSQEDENLFSLLKDRYPIEEEQPLGPPAPAGALNIAREPEQSIWPEYDWLDPILPVPEEKSLVGHMGGEFYIPPEEPAPKSTPEPVPVIPRRPPTGIREPGLGKGLREQEQLDIVLANEASPDLALMATGGNLRRALAVTRGVDIGDESDLKAALEITKHIDADQAKIIEKLANAFGVTPDVVTRDIAKWKGADTARKLLEVALERDANGGFKNPVTAAFLKVPMNLAKAKDDAETLAAIENATFNAFPSKGAEATLSAWRAVTEDVPKSLANFWIALRNSDQPLLWSWPTKPAGKIEPYGPPPAKPEKAGFIYDLFTMTGNVMGASASTIAAGPAGGMAFMWAYIAGSDYGRNRAMGLTDDQAIMPALLNATAQAPLEFLPIRAVARLYRVTGRPFRAMAKDAIIAMMEAGVSETAQQFPDWWSREWAMSKTIQGTPEQQRDWFWNRILDVRNWEAEFREGTYQGQIAAIWAMALGIPAFGRTGAIQQRVIDDRAARREDYAKMAQLVTESKLRARDPEAFEQHNKAVNEAAGVEPFHVDYGEWKTYFQTRPEDEKQVAKDLGVEKQLADAEAREGGDIAIPVEKWNAYVVGTPHEIGLLPHIRFREDDTSDYETEQQIGKATKDLQGKAEEAAKLEEQLRKEPEPEGVKRLRQSIQNVGFDAEAAQFASDIARRMARAIYRDNPESEAAVWDKLAAEFGRFKDRDALAAHLATMGAPPLPPILKGEQELGAIAMHPKGALMAIFEKGDLSTVLHEMSHLFTEKLKEQVEAGKASAPLQRAYEALLGVAGGKLDSQGMEAIARAQEAYYELGKAPTIEAQRAFDFFRRWLSRTSQKAAKANMTEEVRRAFDILHATEREIEDAIAMDKIQAETAALLSDLKASDEAKESVRTRQFEAKEATTSHRLRRMLAAMEKARGGKERIVEQVKNEKVYKAIALVATKGGIRRADLEGFASKAYVDVIAKKFPQVVGKKKNPKVLMLWGTDYGTVEEFVEDLYNALPLKEEIERRYQAQRDADERAARDQLRAGPFQDDEDFLTDERLHAAAAEHAVMAEDAQKEGERRARRLSVEAIKREAAAQLGKMKVSDAIRTDRFQQSARYYARKSVVALKDKKSDEAATFKRLELFYLAMAKESVAFARSYKSLLLMVKNAQKSKYVQHEWQEQIRALADRFYFESTGPIDPEHLATLKDFLQTEITDLDGTQPPIAEWVVNETQAQDHKTRTVEEMRDLKEAFKVLRTRGRDKASSIKEAKHMRFIEIGEKLSEPAKEFLPTLNVTDQHRARRFKWQKTLRTGSAELRTPQLVFRAHDGFPNLKEGAGVNETWLWSPLTRAQSNQNRMILGMNETHLKAIQPLLQKFMRYIRRTHGNDFEFLNGVPLYQDESTRERARQSGLLRWDAEKHLSVILNLGNPGNEHAIRNGHGFDDAQIIAIKEAMTSEGYELVGMIGRAVESLYEVANEAHKRMNGVPMQKVEVQGYYTKTADGKYIYVPGFYYPIIFDGRLSDFVKEKAAKDIIGEQEQWIDAATRWRGPNAQFTKARNRGGYPPLLKLDVFFRHIFDVIHYATHAEILNDIDKITRTDAWRKEFRRVWGNAEYDQIRPLLKYTAIPDTKEVTSFGRWFEKQRQLAVLYLLWGNVRTLIVQPSAIFNAMPDIGADKIIKAVFDCYTNPSMFPEALRKSAYLRECLRSIDRDIASALSKSIDPLEKRIKMFGKLVGRREISEMGMRLIGLVDASVRIPTWWAAYNHGSTNLHMDDDAAITYADSITSGSNPGPRPIDFSSIQRMKGMARLVTTFMGPSIVFGSRMRYFWRGALYSKSPGRWRRLASHVFWEEIIAPMSVTTMLHLAMTGDIPDWKEYLLGQFRWWASFIPGISMLWDRREPNTPAFIGLKAMQKTGKDILTVLSDPTEAEAWSNLALGVGELFWFKQGIPALKVARTAYRGIEEIEEAEIKDIGDVIRAGAAPFVRRDIYHKEHE